MTGVIVGCGMIAGGYDEHAAGDQVRTHAGALARRDVRLLACVEPDEERRAAFMARWNVAHGFDRIEAMLDAGTTADLACVCSPTEHHLPHLAALLAAPVKAVFAEKPLTADVADARRVVADYHAAARPLAVNYSRRWNQALRDLAARIAQGRFGRLTGVTAWYGKGILHNGTHMIDLLRMLIGELRPLRAERLVADGREQDPTLDALLLADRDVPVRLIGTDSRDFELFEVQLRFADCLVSLEQGGASLRTRPIEESREFVGYRRALGGTFADIAPRDTMVRAVDNILAHLLDGEALASDAASALRTQEVAAALVGMVR